MAAPTLDGHAHGTHSSGGNLTVALTTSLTNDIIVVMVYNELNAGAAAVSSVTSPGLTFAKRSSSNGSANGSLEVWWALSAAALTAATITVAFAATYDDASCVAFGVNGCNTVAPWDSNVSLPAHASFTSGSSTPAVTGVSTTQSNDFLIAAIGSVSGTNYNTAPSGWSLIDNAANGGGTFTSELDGIGKGVTSTQSSVTVTGAETMTSAGATTVGGEMIVDALTADSGAPPSTAEVLTTMKEGVGYATPTANVSGVRMEGLGKNTSTKALATTVMKEGVGANPVTKAMPMVTMKEVILLNPMAITITVNNNVALPCGIGNSAAIFQNRLKATSAQVPDSAIIYTIVTPPAFGYFTVNGAVQSTFTQGDIDNGLVIYHASSLAYRYAYEAGITNQYTGENPPRNLAGTFVEYFEPGATPRADSFVFTFGVGTVSPPGNQTFNINLINEGFAIGNEVPGEDGMVEMPVDTEIGEMPVDTEIAEMN
jgi:Cadherin-like